MQKLLKQAGAVIGALAVSFAITAIGQGLWGVMAIVNVKLTPAIPWAAGLMPLVLGALGLFLAGRGWPRRGAASRRALVPLAAVSRQAWIWSLTAGAASVAALAGLWTVFGSLVRTAPNLLPDTHGVPLWTALPMLLVGIAAAPLTEELAFRGYAMGLLRRHLGVVATLVISSLMFAAAHLTHGLYPTKLIVYFLFGLGLAIIVWRTGSLVPAMVVHSFGDLAFFVTVWPHDAGRRLVTEGGADAGFFAAVALTLIGAGVCLAAFRRLVQVSRRGADLPRAAAQPSAEAVVHA